MRAMLTGVLLTMGGALSSAPAMAEDVVSEVGEWRTIMRPQPGQAIDPLCILASPAADDTLRFRIQNEPMPGATGPSRGAAFLDVRVPDQTFAEEELAIEGLRLEVPGQASWSDLKGEWRSRGGGGQLTTFMSSSIDSVIPPLARGSVLTMDVGPAGETKTYEMSLKGSYAALVAFEQCLASVKWVEAGRDS